MSNLYEMFIIKKKVDEEILKVLNVVMFFLLYFLLYYMYNGCIM